jgi:hypothetical protein
MKEIISIKISKEKVMPAVKNKVGVFILENLKKH